MKEFAVRPHDVSHITLARQELDEHSLRYDLFGEVMAGEPGWRMLLEIYVSSEMSRSISITDAAVSSGVATTTAVRWLVALEEMKLVYRIPAENDKRRTWLKLTPEGQSLIRGYLKRLSQLRRRMDQPA